MANATTAATLTASKTNGKAKAASASASASAPASPALSPEAYAEAADMIKIVSDATRLQIVHMLSGSPLHVGAMCAAIGQSQPAVSHHLALLRASGVVAAKRDGKSRYYSLTAKGEALLALAMAAIAG